MQEKKALEMQVEEYLCNRNNEDVNDKYAASV